MTAAEREAALHRTHVEKLKAQVAALSALVDSMRTQLEQQQHQQSQRQQQQQQQGASEAAASVQLSRVLKDRDALKAQVDI